MLDFDDIYSILLIAAPAIVIGATVYLVVQAVTRHRERMAKIEQGIDPDSPASAK